MLFYLVSFDPLEGKQDVKRKGMCRAYIYVAPRPLLTASLQTDKGILSIIDWFRS